ncbi:MAG: ABC transporter permease [Cellvibrionaceae bacterium]
MEGFIKTMFALRTLWAIFIALLLGAVLIAIVGAHPIDAYRVLFKEAFFDYWGVANTLVKMSPILLAGLAVVVPLRAGLFNIGGEGQIYIGGLFGTIIGLSFADMPALVGIPVILFSAMLGGGLWAAIPGYLKAYHGINEVIVTLLMNFIAIHIVSYAVSGPMLAENAPYPYSEELASHLLLPILMPQTDTHLGVLIGILLAIFLYFYYRYTPSGFAMDTVGKNSIAANYAGIDVKRQILKAMIAGGAIAGLAGGIEVIGFKYRLFHLFSPGYGFDGIIVAFIAVANPIFVPFASFFLAGLQTGAGAMQRVVGVEATVAEALQGLVVILVAASLALRFENSALAIFFRKRKANKLVHIKSTANKGS